MKRLRYAVATSLDGYIAGPKGEADWIVMDPDVDFGSIFNEFDTLVMGRRTFTAMGDTGSGEFGGPFRGMKIVVVSRTLDKQRYPKATIVSENLKGAIAAMKQEPGKDIWLFGGGHLFQSLLDLDLVDTVEVAVIPVLLGQGIPLLPGAAKRAQLVLTSHTVYPKTGTIALAYDVTRAKKRSQRASPQSGTRELAVL